MAFRSSSVGRTAVQFDFLSLSTVFVLTNEMPQTLDSLAQELSRNAKAIERRKGEAIHVAKEGQLVQAEAANLEGSLETHDAAIAALQSLGETRQADLQRKIETLVTHGLRSIFGGDLAFAITPKTSGKTTSLDMTIRSTVANEVIETSIMDARGGGIAAVAGFLLRLLVLLLQKDKVSPILILDETFAQVSSDYEEGLAAFIRELVDKTDVQILMVTHSPTFTEVADKTYRFALKDGKTVVD